MDKVTKIGIFLTIAGVVITLCSFLRDLFDITIKKNVDVTEANIYNPPLGESSKNYELQNNQSCMFSLLNKIDSNCLIEVYVEVDDKFNQQTTLEVKQEIESQIKLYFSKKNISVLVYGSKDSKINRKYYSFQAKFKFSFMQTEEIISSPSINTEDIITGKTRGNFSLFKMPSGDQVFSCPFSSNLAGVEEADVKLNLIDYILKEFKR